MLHCKAFLGLNVVPQDARTNEVYESQARNKRLLAKAEWTWEFREK
jgi:hypothetical protein